MTYENVPFPLEITKEGAQSLRMKMPNAEFNFIEATVIYRFYVPAAARLPELTSKSVGKTGLLAFVPLRAKEKALNHSQLITRRVSDDTELLRLNSLR